MIMRRNLYIGISLIEILVAIAIVSLLLGLLLAAVQKLRATAARSQCQNHLRQIALAVHLYHDAHRRLPPGHSMRVDNNRYRYLGWTGRILPYIEQEPLWRQIEQAFATDPNPDNFYGHPAHLPILGTVIRLYICPSDYRIQQAVTSGNYQYAFTSYMGVIGRDYTTQDGTLFCDSQICFTDIRDGLSNTILLGERPPSFDFRFGWWYRGWGQNKTGSAEMILGVRELNALGTRYPCPTGPYYFRTDQLDNPCHMFHFWSLHSGGANFAAVDCSVRFLPYTAEAYLPALASRAGAEPWSWPD